MGILPWDFWAMTPRELSLQVEGSKTRQKWEYEQIAHLACWLINSQPGRKRSKQIKVSDLLSPPKRRQRRIDDVVTKDTKKT